jgi:hypothetical protein
MATEQELIIAKLEGLSKDIELLRARQGENRSDVGKSEPEDPWYVKWVKILGIPGIVILMLMQWGQFTLNTESTDKTRAETQKIEVERLKTQAELEKMLIELEKTRSANTPNVEEETRRLQAAIDELQRLRSVEMTTLISDLFVKFVILWFVLRLIGWFFDVVATVWSIMLSAAVTALFSWDFGWMRKLRGVVQVASVVLHIVPQLLRWSVEIFVLLAVFQPVAFEAAILLGRPDEFTGMMSDVFDFHIGAAAESLQRLLLGAGGI